MRLPTQDETVSFGRHVISYAMGAVSALSALHMFQNPADAQQAATALTQIGHGFEEILAGGSTLVAVTMGVWAAIRQSPLFMFIKGATAVASNRIDTKAIPPEAQKVVMIATEKLPKVDTVVTNDPMVAATTVSPNIVSKDQVLVKKLGA